MTQVGPGYEGGFSYGDPNSQPPVYANPMGPSVAQPMPPNPVDASNFAMQQQMAQMAQMQNQMLTMQMQQMTVPLTAAQMCALTQDPCSVQCPHCQATGLTTVEKKAGTTAYANAIIISLVGCCCLVPLFWNLHKDTIHYCSNCKQEIGRHIVKTGNTSSRRRRRRR